MKEEQKQKLSKYWKKYWSVPENLEKKKQYAKEVWSRIEFKESMKEKHKKRCNTQDFKEHRSKKQKEKWNDINYRQKQLKKIINGITTEEIKQKRKESTKQSWLDKTVKAKRLEGIKKQKNTFESKKKMSMLLKSRWSNPEYKQRVIHLIVKANGANNSKLEVYVREVLNKLYLGDWIHNNKRPFNVIYGKVPDFYHISLPIVIEVNGDYWHGEEVVGVDKNTHEQQMIEHYKKYGYNCIIFWEFEVKGMNFEYLVVERLSQLYLKIKNLKEEECKIQQR